MPRDFEDICRRQRCYLAFPGICSFDPAKVVPCHLRIGNVAGVGQKPPPLCCLPGCFECHAVLDGRVQSEHSREQILAWTLMGKNQWDAWMWHNEILIPGGIAA